MAGINVEHINPFLMAAKKVFQDMCFVDLNIGKPIIKDANFEQDSWIIIIGVTGEMRGQVMIGFTNEIACAVASKMCMMEVTQIDDFASSAICELGNMTMGNAATVFSSNSIGIDITPPTLSHGQVQFTTKFTKTLCIPLTFEDKVVELYLALRDED